MKVCFFCSPLVFHTCSCHAYYLITSGVTTAMSLLSHNSGSPVPPGCQPISSQDQAKQNPLRDPQMRSYNLVSSRSSELSTDTATEGPWSQSYHGQCYRIWDFSVNVHMKKRKELFKLYHSGRLLSHSQLTQGQCTHFPGNPSHQLARLLSLTGQRVSLFLHSGSGNYRSVADMSSVSDTLWAQLQSWGTVTVLHIVSSWTGFS